jgi:hypothetical protein
MSLSVVLNVVRRGIHRATKTVATAMGIVAMVTEPLAKCSLRYVQIVARKLKYRSNHAKADQCIVVIATAK